MNNFYPNIRLWTTFTLTSDWTTFTLTSDCEQLLLKHQTVTKVLPSPAGSSWRHPKWCAEPWRREECCWDTLLEKSTQWWPSDLHPPLLHGRSDWQHPSVQKTMSYKWQARPGFHLKDFLLPLVSHLKVTPSEEALPTLSIGILKKDTTIFFLTQFNV